MPILSPKELELIREKRRMEGGAMPPSSVYEGTSREAVERDVANRIMNPDGGLDLATARAMAKNEGNPSFQLPASSVMTREMKLAENAARDPNLFRSLAGGLTVDPFRRKAREWRFLQEQEDAIDAGVFGRAEDVRRLQQAGLSLEKIGEMTPEEMRRELAFTGANSSYDYMRGGKSADESQKELHSGLYNSVVDTHKDINRKLFGAKDSVIGGLFDRIADHYEVTTAQRQPDGIVGQAGHAIVRSVPDMFVRRLPEFAARSLFGGGAAILTSIFSTIKEAASEGGAAYDEYRGKDPETWKKDALLAGLKTERENLHILGLSNTGQAALANRYMPKLMDAFKKGGKESYGKVFAFILDSVIQGGEEVAQGISSRKNLDQPMDIGELAFEGIVGAGASMLTAGLGAGYAKGFESYSARKAAGDARDYWYPKFNEWLKEKNLERLTEGHSPLNTLKIKNPEGYDPNVHHNIAIVMEDGTYTFIPKVDKNGKKVSHHDAQQLGTHVLDHLDSKEEYDDGANKERTMPKADKNGRTIYSEPGSVLVPMKAAYEGTDAFGPRKPVTPPYTIDDAMAHFGINKDSFDPKKIRKVPINKTHAWVRMFAEQQARKNASDEDIENARLEGEEKLRREKAVASKAGSGITVEKPDAASGKKPVTYDRVTQDDISDAGSLEQFAGFVFNPKAMSGADDATRSKAILMAKDFYMNNSGKWNADSSYGIDAVRGLYSSVYDIMPQSVKNRYSKDSFIKANFLWAEHSAAESELQKVVRKKADEKREAVVSNPDVDPEVAKATEEIIQQVVERDKNQDELGTGELKPDIKAAYRDTPSTDDIHLSDIDANKVIDEAIGKSDRLTEDSTPVEVADALFGFEDGPLGELLSDTDLLYGLEPDAEGNPITKFDREQLQRKIIKLNSAMESLKEIITGLESVQFSPEDLQATMDILRAKVKHAASVSNSKWGITEDVYSANEFMTPMRLIFNKYNLPDNVILSLGKAMDDLNKAANDARNSIFTDKNVKKYGRGLIRTGVRPNTETGRILLTMRYYDAIIKGENVAEHKREKAQFAKDVMKSHLHELNESRDMVQFLVNEMFLPVVENQKGGNFPEGISQSAIDKAIAHFKSKGGKEGARLASKFEAMSNADNYSATSGILNAIDEEDDAEVAARTEETDRVFNDLVEEALTYANLFEDRKRYPISAGRAASFLDEISGMFYSLARKGKTKEFLYRLNKRLDYWKNQANKSHNAKGTKGQDMYDLYRSVNLNSLENLSDANGKILLDMDKYREAFPLTRVWEITRDIAKARAFENARLSLEEKKANEAENAKLEALRKQFGSQVAAMESRLASIKSSTEGVDLSATEEVFGTQDEQQETPPVESGRDDFYDSFPVGIVAGQQVATAPSSERTGLAGKIASVLLRANAKTPDAFNTVHDRMRKFINGKETIISHALDRMFDMAEKIPEIRDQVANIFNYSIGSGVSLASVDESVREDLQNVLTALDEVTRVRKDNGMTGGPKKSSDLVRSINHDMRDNPDFVPDPKALADFAIGAMKDGKAMSFEEGLALAHKVLNRDAYGDLRLEQMPKYMQDLLGYSPDPLVQLYMNSRKLVRDTARQLFEKNLLEDTKVVADTQLEPDYVQLVSGDKAKYYSLEGKWVPPEVASVLQQDEKARNELVRGYLMIHSMFKQMKIIYSTTSYVNNFFGNFFLMQMGGIPLHESVKRYPKAAKEVFNWITGGKISARLKEAIDNGLFDNTMTSSELALSSSNMEALNKLKGSDFSKTNQVLFSALNKLENNKVGKFGRHLYEGIEQVHRYIAYQYFRDVGYTQDVNRKGLDPSAPAATMVLNLNPFRKKVPMSAAQAVAQVDKTLFNYRHLPTGVKALRDTGIPFISFPYLAGRSFLRNMTENPTGIISMMLTGMLLREAVRALTRGRKELELEGWIPYWEVIDPLQRSNKRWGEDWLDAIKGNFTPGGPMMMIPEIIRGKKFFGDIPISERRDREPTDGEIGRHVWDTMGPSVLVSGLRNVESVQKGKDSVGNRIFRQFGIRLRDSDRGALRKDLNRLNMKIREQQREYNRGNITYGDMMENIGKIRNAAEGLRKDFGSPFGVGP